MAENRGIQTAGMTPPKVSVIIPVYNGERTIRRSIDSVLMQDIPLELILVNDCSTDATAEILSEYAAADPRVRVLHSASSQGAGGSRNAGVRLARAEYTAFLDADDIWEAGKLKRQLALLDRSGAALCCTGRELMTADGRRTGRVIGVREEITYRSLLRHNCINCSSVLLPTRIAREFPMEHEDSHEDYITWLRILKKYGRAAGINEPLLCYRLSAAGKSGSKLKSARMTFRAYRYLGFGLPRSLVCFASYALHGVWKYARSCRRFGRISKAV